VNKAIHKIKAYILQCEVQTAYAMINEFPPDIRVALKPFVTHFSGAKTVLGTARATMDFIRTITQGTDALVSGQISLEGEVYGIHSTIGVPFVIGNQGVDRIFEIPISEEEKTCLMRNAEEIQKKIKSYI
jgi:malate dehydrogenase